MDWIRKNVRMSVADLATFEYQPQRCQVLQVPQDVGTQTIQSEHAMTEDEWKRIFELERKAAMRNEHCGGSAILASRVAEESDDKENYHDPSILSKLPFSEAT